MTGKSAIFISYRRSDSQDFAERIYDRLVEEFDKDTIFIDVAEGNIPPGEEYRRVLFERVSNCNVFLVLIGAKWLDIRKDPKNRKSPRRLDDEDDMVRFEIQTALNNANIRVIPVLLDTEVNLPEKKQLPSVIDKLVDLQSSRVLRTPDFSSSMDRLIATIRSLDNFKPVSTHSSSIETPSETTLTRDNRVTFFAALLQSPLLLAILAGVLVLVIGGWSALRSYILSPNSEDSDTPTLTATVTDAPTITAAVTDAPPEVAIVNKGASDSIVTERFRVPLEGHFPSELVVAPSSRGEALWGYDPTRSTVFTLSLKNGQLLEDYPLSEAVSGDIRPNLLHYDGEWLWIGDSLNTQLIAFDPYTFSPLLTLDLDNVPTGIASTSNKLWVIERNQSSLQAFALDREAQSASPVCQTSTSIDLPITPLQVVAQSDQWIWVTDETSMYRLSPIACELSEAITFTNIQQLSVANKFLYVLAENKLWYFDTPAKGLHSVSLGEVDTTWDNILTLGDGLLLFEEGKQTVRHITIKSDTVTFIHSLVLQRPLLTTIVNGHQLWIVSDNGFLAQYILPDITVPNLASIAWTDDALWSLSDDLELCRLPENICHQLEGIDAKPSVFAASFDLKGFWLSTDDRRIWFIEVNDFSVNLLDTLPAVALTLVDDGQRLWVANVNHNLFGFVSAGSFETVSPTVSFLPPDAMSYDGQNLWFAFGNVRQEAASFRYLPDQKDLIQQSDSIPIRLSQINAIDSSQGYLVIVGEGTAILTDPLGRIMSPQQLGVGENAATLASDGNTLWVGERAPEGAIYTIFHFEES